MRAPKPITRQVTALSEDVRQRRRGAMDAVTQAFAVSPADLHRAAAELVAVRYFDRFLAEVAHGEPVDAPGGANVGTRHAG